LFLQPLKRKKEEETLFNMDEGERNNALFRHLIKLKKAGFSPKKYTTLGLLINDYIFKRPLHDDPDRARKEVLNTSASVYKREVKINAQGDNPFQIYNSRGDAVAINERAIVEHFLEYHPVIVLKGTAYAYKDGVYQEAMLELKKTISDLITEDRLVTHSRIADTYRLLVDQPNIQKTAADLERYTHIICFKNGVYDTNRRTFLSHSPKYLHMTQIPWELHMESKKKRIQETKFFQFYSRLCKLSSQDMRMLLEYMAYMLTSRMDLRAFMCLHGPTRTGKSLLIKWCEMMVGKHNCSNLTLQQIGERFYSAQLLGKMLNTCADNPSLPLKAIDVLKRITGGDRILAEFKGRDSFSFSPTCKLIFSFNQLPLQLEERSDAFYDRIRILSMPLPISPGQEIIDKLYANEAFEELLPFLVKIACRLTEISNAPTSRLNIHKLHEDSDPLFGFFNSPKVSIVDKRGANFNSQRKDIYTAFTEYCLETSRKACGKHQFFRHIETLGYIFYKTKGNIYVEKVKLNK
jgi:P4 family phage/plasmid primase-like protien